MPLGAHENHLLDTGDKLFLDFDCNAKEYNDETSVGYDKDDYDNDSPDKDDKERTAKVVDNPC